MITIALISPIHHGSVTGRPPADDREQGSEGNPEVPLEASASERRGSVGQTWFPPRERAGGERRSLLAHLDGLVQLADVLLGSSDRAVDEALVHPGAEP